jgi:two-component system cell cycle response regulator
VHEVVDMTSATFDRWLAWERGLLRAETLELWLERLTGSPPSGRRDDLAVLLLVDPTHELRHLVMGNHDLRTGSSPVTFVASLAGLAPHLLSLQEAWRGGYRAVDHALLFPGADGLREVMVLPLRRADHLVGLFNVATRDGAPAFDGMDAPLLDNVADLIVAGLDRHLDRARALRGGMVDPLTGWNSPRYVQARLREEIARCQRERGSVACLVVDVDRLQALNDELGQLAGDQALRELAGRIESQVRASDTAAHLGSDGFVVVLPGTDARRAVPLAERILGAVRAAPLEVGAGARRPVRVSIGIAGAQPQLVQDRKAVADQLFADALAALHRAKQAGGDRFEIDVPRQGDQSGDGRAMPPI